MLKNNKWKLIISSVLILLPIIIGVIFWDRLPEKMATHWGANGEADGWSSPFFAVVLMPLFLLVLHWICLLVTQNDNRFRNQSGKVINIAFWLCPVISWFTSGITYAAALDLKINLVMVVCILMGVLFIIIGNYLPKCKQNYTMGIKIHWTLANEENWNRTHRFAGKAYVVGGVIFILCSFLGENALLYAIFPLILIVASLPALYSYLLYKKHIKDGTYTNEDYNFTLEKKYKRVSLIVVPVIILILAGCLAIMFTGDIDAELNDTSFTVIASYYDDITIEYKSIDSIELRENDSVGARTYGFASPRLLMGNFKNDEFGKYTRYSYANQDCCIVLKAKEKILVISLRNENATRQLYEELISKINN